MPKKLTDKEKDEIIKGFLNGKSLELLSKQFAYTKLTISRNLKKNLGEEEYNNFLNKNKTLENHKNKNQNPNKNFEDTNFDTKLTNNLVQSNKESLNNNFIKSSEFMEIVPLSLDINSDNRKDLSSIPIDQIEFPKIVYIIVDKNIELEIKTLKEYPEWEFLPENDLGKKTIEIYSDLKDAKRSCKKDQKVIKVPNTNVFKIASKILISRGITRIISDKELIAL